ncbi:MAG: nuclear transport factor 2 family protein [Armatimonadetes bacterium]|nr:nuclear transport factor 2 family protein [Armatimonadota bacterium]
MSTTAPLSSNLKTVLAVYDAFGRNDVPTILGHLHENVAWTCRFDPVVPWGGNWTGREGAAAFFRTLDESVEVMAFEVIENVAKGETVVSLGTFTCKVRSTGKTSHTRWAFVWRFEQGSVVSYEQFHDPAIAEAFKP